MNTQHAKLPRQAVNLPPPTPTKPARPRTLVEAMARRYEGRPKKKVAGQSTPIIHAPKKPTSPVDAKLAQNPQRRPDAASTQLHMRSVRTKILLERQNERGRNTRLRRKIMLAGNAKTQRITLCGKLAHYVTGALRGERIYTYRLSELIDRVGSAPSAAWARSPPAAIVGHVASIAFWLPIDNMGIIFIRFSAALL